MYLSIAYTTGFDYPDPVRQSHNELRAAPTTGAAQRLLSYRLTTSPAARAFSFIDYWGTIVDAFGIRRHHDALEVQIEAVVETLPERETPDEQPLDLLVGEETIGLYWELLQPTRHTEITPEVATIAEEGQREAVGCVDLAQRLSDAAHERLAYRSGATSIGDSIAAILDKGEGVCQDYAHLLVALCRAAGLPARYVSGYLYAADHGTGETGESEVVVVQTHAWVEALVPGGGWFALDPTNRQAVGERHVKIGAGRDYDDVAPFRGTYVGGPVPELTTSVEMRLLEDPGPRLLQARQAQQ